MVGALIPFIWLVLSFFAGALWTGKDRAVVAQTVKAEPVCCEKSLQEWCLEVLVHQEVEEVGQALGTTSRIYNSSSSQAAADQEIQHSEDAGSLEMSFLLGAGGRPSNTLQGLQSSLEASRPSIQSSSGKQKGKEVSKCEKTPTKGIKFERCGELREDRRAAGRDGIHRQVALGGDFAPDKSGHSGNQCVRVKGDNCSHGTTNAIYSEHRGTRCQPGSPTSPGFEASLGQFATGDGSQTAGVRRQGQGSCLDSWAFEQIGKDLKAAQRNRHQTYCDGRELASLFQKGPAEVRAASNHVSSEQARTGQILHGKDPRVANGQARDSASIASADAASVIGPTSTGRPSGGCRSCHDGSDGAGCTAVTGGDGTDVSQSSSVRGYGWNPGDLRGSSGSTRCTKVTAKEGCAQAIQQSSDHFPLKSRQPASQAEGRRQGEGQIQSYYVKLVDEVKIQEDDTIQSMLNQGPNLGRCGIVTFCDQVEVREFDPEEITSQVSGEFQTKTIFYDKPRQASSEVECSKWSEAPCPCNLWCADLHWATSSGCVDGFDMQGSISTFLAELDRGPEYEQEANVTLVAAVDDNQDSSSTSYGPECDADQDNFDSPFDDPVSLFQTFCEEIDIEWTKVIHPLYSLRHNWSTSFRSEGDADDNPMLMPHRIDEEDIDEPIDEDEEESPTLLDIPIFSRTWEDIENTMVENQDEQGQYPVVTFGIATEPLGRRDVLVTSLDPYVLRSELYEAWQDKVPHFGTIEAHFVLPQPKTELKITKATVLTRSPS